jgi:hypothetical protein
MVQDSSMSYGSVAENELLIFDNPRNLPRHFRSPAAVPSPPSYTGPCSIVGLNHLQASGSAQFTVDELQYAIKTVSKSTKYKVTVVDLRQECHGFLVVPIDPFPESRGIPISWYGDKDWSNVGKPLKWIRDQEVLRLQQLAGHTVTVYVADVGGDGKIERRFPVSIKVKQALTEEQVAESLGFGYHRIPVTDHCPPTLDAVESFIFVVRPLEPNVWLHFHCHGGDGRTTSFLAMYDMIRNANNVGFEDIIARQAILGPENLAKLPSETSWKFRCAKQRLAFLQCFYEYVRVGYGRGESFTKWLDGNPPCRKTLSDCTGLLLGENL